MQASEHGQFAWEMIRANLMAPEGQNHLRINFENRVGNGKRSFPLKFDIVQRERITCDPFSPDKRNLRIRAKQACGNLESLTQTRRFCGALGLLGLPRLARLVCVRSGRFHFTYKIGFEWQILYFPRPPNLQLWEARSRLYRHRFSKAKEEF